ncbi:hypothetical protein GCM10009564_12570 [Streptomyces thermogriseus]|uniref:Uncharacterized protein n=1 Tax=Streptomyces thermogriseus TaxID=75292 RepID=A0ABP4DH59_9ACTN
MLLLTTRLFGWTASGPGGRPLPRHLPDQRRSNPFRHPGRRIVQPQGLRERRRTYLKGGTSFGPFRLTSRESLPVVGVRRLSVRQLLWRSDELTPGPAPVTGV